MVVFDQMRPGSDDAHLSGQNVEELREFIDAESAQETARGKDAAITPVACFACSWFVRVHGSEFHDLEPAILNAGSRLAVKQADRETGRAGRF